MAGNGFRIEIADRQKRLTVDSDWLIHGIEQVLVAEGISAANISVALVDDPTIWQLNRQHLAHDYPTDVLSFLLDQESDWLEGEIIASTDTAVREAAAFGWAPEHELLLYLVHGTLHLIGYDDCEPDQLAIMRQREQTYMRHILGCDVPRGDRSA